MLNEGELEAGQDIVKISDEPEQVSVAEIDALLYLPGHPRDNIERALRIPALSPGWKDSLQSLLEQSDTPTTFAGNSGLTGVTTRPPAWQGFRPMRVVATQTESRNVRSVMLSDPDGTPRPNGWPGSQSRCGYRRPVTRRWFATIRCATAPPHTSTEQPSNAKPTGQPVLTFMTTSKSVP